MPNSPFAISQVENRGFVREAESQLKIPSGPFPTTPFPLKWQPPRQSIRFYRGLLPAIVSRRELRPDRGSCMRFSLLDEPTLLVKAGPRGKGISDEWGESERFVIECA